MTSQRHPDQVIRAYLDDGPTELPDHVYDAVRDGVDDTRQRVVFGRWSGPQNSRFAALATAAVLVIAATIGLNLALGQGQVGGPPPPPPPTASPSPAPSASPSPSAARLPTAAVRLDPGTYYIGPSITNAERVTLTVPAGWTVDEQFLYRDRGGPGEVMLVTWVVTHVFADACQWEGTLRDAGTTVEDLVLALSSQGAREASMPVDVTLGGFPAKRIELTVPADLDVATCSQGGLRYWPDPGPDLSGGLCCNAPGNIDVVYVVDVAGNRMVLVARHYPDSSTQSLAELQGIVDSIQIDPLD